MQLLTRRVASTVGQERAQAAHQAITHEHGASRETTKSAHAQGAHQANRSSGQASESTAQLEKQQGAHTLRPPIRPNVPSKMVDCALVQSLLRSWQLYEGRLP